MQPQRHSLDVVQHSGRCCDLGSIINKKWVNSSFGPLGNAKPSVIPVFRRNGNQRISSSRTRSRLKATNALHKPPKCWMLEITRHTLPTSNRPSGRGALSLLQLTDWNKDLPYHQDPLAYIHSTIRWRLIVNSRTIIRDTKPNLFLVPDAFWSTTL